jgi:hypothetical protein
MPFTDMRPAEYILIGIVGDNECAYFGGAVKRLRRKLHVNYFDRDPDPAVTGSAAKLALQHGLGILPQWRSWFGFANCPGIGA